MKNLLIATAPPATVLIRLMAGGSLVLQGIQQFSIGPAVLHLFPGPLSGHDLGPPFFGRHYHMFTPVTLFEGFCGVLILLGLLTRPSALLVATLIIWEFGTYQLDQFFQLGGANGAEHNQLECCVALACVFLVIVGAGSLSLDSRIIRREDLSEGTANRGKEGALSFQSLATTSAPAATLLIRLTVAGVCLAPLLFHLTEIPAIQVVKAKYEFIYVESPGVLYFLALCGILVAVGSLTRVVSAMIVAPILWLLLLEAYRQVFQIGLTGFSPTQMPEGLQLIFGILFAGIFLMIVGAGPISVDALVARRAQAT